MAIGAYGVKHGETARTLRAQLTDADGPIPVQTAAVEFRMRSLFDPTVIVGGLCAVIDDGTEENRGWIEFRWDAGFWADTDPGIYAADFKIRFNPDTVEERVTYVPSDEWDTVEVLSSPDLP